MTAYRKSVAVLSALALLAACGKNGTQAPQAPARESAVEATSPEITGDDLRKHVKILASDEFGGRAPTTPGGKKARAYIASEFERIGLQPVNGGYEQEVPMVETTVDPEKSYLKIDENGNTQDLAYKDDVVYWTKRAEKTVSFDDSDMVFVGYGIVAPEYGWNDYEGVDVKGKTVVILVNDPGFATKDTGLFNGNAMTYYGRWTYKYEEAARQGAAAAIIVHETEPAAYGWNVVEGSWTGPQIDLERADNGASRVAMEGWVTHDAASALMQAAGLDLGQMEDAAAKKGFKAVPMTGLKASGKIEQTLKRSKSANVIGVLPGAEAPDEYVLYTAHWDHLGTKPNAEGDDKIFNGAVDNGTGVAAILEIAEKFAETKPKRSILIAAVTGEESGLLGSAYMAENPPVPLKQIVAGINIDALLPTPPVKDIVVVGYGASELEDVLSDVAARHTRRIKPDPEPEKGYFYRSDHISFAKKGVPMLYADNGVDLVDGGVEAGEALAEDYRLHRYHSPADEYDDSWDMSGITDTVEILYETGELIADSSAWPDWYEGNEFRAIRDAQRSGE